MGTTLEATLPCTLSDGRLYHFLGGCIDRSQTLWATWISWLSTTVVCTVFVLFWACSRQTMHMRGTDMNQKFGLLQEMIASKGRPGRGQCILQGQGWKERGLTRKGMLKGSCERALTAVLCTARQLGQA